MKADYPFQIEDNKNKSFYGNSKWKKIKFYLNSFNLQTAKAALLWPFSIPHRNHPCLFLEFPNIFPRVLLLYFYWGK